MNSILYTVWHFLMQIAISQEFPLENIAMIFSVSCLHVTYNAAAYTFVSTIFHHISGVVLIFYKEVNNQYLYKKSYFVTTLKMFHKNSTSTVLSYHTDEDKEGGV